MDELTYQKDGVDIKTSKFLRNRKSCCKTTCLHCPYGFTLKKEGLTLEPVNADNFAEAEELASKAVPEINDIAASLLASAFGGPKAVDTLTKQNQDNYLLVKIKGQTCAIAKRDKNRIVDLQHKKYFDDQGITKEMVESFLDERE